MSDAKAKPCPICKKPAQPAYRPFCSPRCADIDLHRWFSGSYVVPGAQSDDEDDPPPPPRRSDDES